MSIKIQPRIKGQRRTPMYGGALPDLERAIRFTARRFNVSPSWVIIFACGEFFGIDVIDYRTPQRRQHRRRRAA